MEEHFKYIWDQVDKWLSFAEAKNAALIAFNVAVLAVIGDLELKSYEATIIIILLIIAMLISMISFIPNLNSKILNKNDKSLKNEVITEKNLLFYGHIGNIKNAEQFIKETRDEYFSEESDKTAFSKLNIDLASEIIINSKIAIKKYKFFKIASLLDSIALIGIIILKIAPYIISNQPIIYLIIGIIMGIFIRSLFK